MFLTYSITSFASGAFSTQLHPLFVFLQFEADSDKNTLELSNEVLLSHTKLNYVKHQSHEGISVRERDKYIASFLFEEKISKFNLLN